MNDDASLLRSFADHGSEAAFAELVRRHLDLVYGTALRRTGGDTHSAADVAQQVFTKLAQNARKLSPYTVVGAWLHTATRNAALNLMISDQRRKTREAAALTLHATEESSLDWERLRPLLDEAIDELPETDRSAVVLRFLEHRAFAEIGTTLRLSEEAARKRVDRALEKLRAALGRRGVNSTSAALAVAFANQVGATAPVGLAASISGVALESAAAAGGIAATGAGIFMSMKTTAVVSAVALAAIGSTIYQWSSAFRAESELALLKLDHDGLRTQLAVEKQRTARVRSDVVALRNEIEMLKTKQIVAATPKPTTPVESDAARQSKIKNGIMSNLAQIAAMRDQFELEKGRPPASIDDLVGPDKYIKRLVAVNGESYSGLSMGQQVLVVTSPDGVTATYDPDVEEAALRQSKQVQFAAATRAIELGQRIGPALSKAIAAYKAANNNQIPPNQEAYIPYFATSQEGADFVEFLEAQKKARPREN